MDRVKDTNTSPLAFMPHRGVFDTDPPIFRHALDQVRCAILVRLAILRSDLHPDQGPPYSHPYLSTDALAASAERQGNNFDIRVIGQRQTC